MELYKPVTILYYFFPHLKVPIEQNLWDRVNRKKD